MPTYLVKSKTITEATYKVVASDLHSAIELVEEFDDGHPDVTFLDVHDGFDDFEAKAKPALDIGIEK